MDTEASVATSFGPANQCDQNATAPSPLQPSSGQARHTRCRRSHRALLSHLRRAIRALLLIERGARRVGGTSGSNLHDLQPSSSRQHGQGFATRRKAEGHCPPLCYRVSEDALGRHKKHMQLVIAKAAAAVDQNGLAYGSALLAEIGRIKADAERLQSEAERRRDVRAALKAIHERLAIVELEAKRVVVPELVFFRGLES